jgi:hypothetical protein
LPPSIEEPFALSVSAADGHSWHGAIAELAERVTIACEGTAVELPVECVFEHRGASAPFGVHLRSSDTGSSRLIVRVGLPAELADDPADELLALLRQAVEAAEQFADRLGREDPLLSAWRVIGRLESGNDLYERWLDRYESAWLAPTSVDRIPCPECEGRQLMLEIELYRPTAESCTAWFWCSACLRGILVRAPFPSQGTPQLAGTTRIPKFAIVAPD